MLVSGKAFQKSFSGVLKQPMKDWVYDDVDPGKTQQKSALMEAMG